MCKKYAGLSLVGRELDKQGTVCASGGKQKRKTTVENTGDAVRVPFLLLRLLLCLNFLFSLTSPSLSVRLSLPPPPPFFFGCVSAFLSLSSPLCASLTLPPSVFLLCVCFCLSLPLSLFGLRCLNVKCSRRLPSTALYGLH